MTDNIHAHAASPMLRALAAIAYEAGAIILKHYADEIVSRRKEDESPVTAADEEAERFILKRLAHLAPDVPVLAEEAVAAGRIPKIGHRFFLVDPLDGTKEFISRNGEFTVNIAEIVEGKPVRGVVHAPAIERLFFGEVLSGAYEAFAPPGGAPDFAEAKRIQARAIPKDGMVAVASRSHRDAKTDEYLAQFKVREFVSAGSSLKFCLVAAGRSRHLSAYRPHHGMGYGGRPCGPVGGGRRRHTARRRAVPLRQGRAGLRQPLLRGTRPDLAVEILAAGIEHECHQTAAEPGRQQHAKDDEHPAHAADVHAGERVPGMDGIPDGPEEKPGHRHDRGPARDTQTLRWWGRVRVHLPAVGIGTCIWTLVTARATPARYIPVVVAQAILAR